MEQFVKEYKKAYDLCKEQQDNGFFLEEKVFIDFFNRNEKMLQDEMKSEVEQLTESIGEFDDTTKVTVANWYLNYKLDIDGFYTENNVEYEIE